VVVAAYGTSADGLVREVVHGAAFVMAYYTNDEFDAARLVAAMQTVAPRQLVPGHVRCAMPSPDRWAAWSPRCWSGCTTRRRGQNVEPFIQRVPVSSRVRAGEARSRGSQEANRQREARAALNDQLKRFGVGTRHVRQWARDSGHTVRDNGGLPLGIIREFLHAHEIPMPT